MRARPAGALLHKPLAPTSPRRLWVAGDLFLLLTHAPWGPRAALDREAGQRLPALGPAACCSFGVLLIALVTQQRVTRRGAWRLPEAPQECPRVRRGGPGRSGCERGGGLASTNQQVETAGHGTRNGASQAGCDGCRAGLAAGG